MNENQLLNSISGNWANPFTNKELYEETERVMLNNPSLSREQAQYYAQRKIDRRRKEIKTTQSPDGI